MQKKSSPKKTIRSLTAIKGVWIVLLLLACSVVVINRAASGTSPYPNPTDTHACPQNQILEQTPPQVQAELPDVPSAILNFSQAKQLAKLIHHDHRITFYCGCQYDKQHKIDLGSCGYQIQKDKRRAERVEWEHIVPVSLWGQHLPCWNEPLCCGKRHCYKGRACCQKIDLNFARMEGDLHNLVPEIGELNALRSNFRFGELPFIAVGQFGLCAMKIDPETRRVEPPAEVKGMVARAYLYMADTYGIKLSSSQQQLYHAWHKAYPPDNWEITWDNRIAETQGNHNHYIQGSLNARINH